MKERDLNKTLTQADAYEKMDERVGNLAAQLHDRDQLIKRLEEDCRAAEERAKQTEKALRAENEQLRRRHLFAIAQARKIIDALDKEPVNA